MNERDELAKLIAETKYTNLQPAWDEREDRSPVKYFSRKQADAILAAGYSKPRTITTEAELDALPEGTAIVDQAERLTFEETSLGCVEWVDRHGNACWVELPATVLYTTKES